MPRGRNRRPREAEPFPIQRRTGPDGAEAGVGGTGRARQGRAGAFAGPATQWPGPQHANTMNPTQSMKLIVWTGCATRWALVVIGLTSGLLVMAQEPDTASQTNDVMATEALSRLNDLVQGADSAQPEDMAPANDLSSTNNIDQPGTPASSADGTPRINRFDAAGRTDSNSRSQSASDRRSRGRRRSRSDQSGGFGSASDSSQGSGGTNNGPITLDYSSFKVVVDKNIFDPNRQPQRGPRTVRPTPKSFDSLTLVGTMTYEKGTFAFFDGTSAEYKKALKLADAIAGYKVTNIAPTT